MKKLFVLFTSFFLTACLCACSLPVAATPGTPDPGMIATQVALTMAVFTQSAQPAPLASPTLQLLNSPTPEQPTNTQPVASTPTLTPTSGPSATMTLTLAASSTPIPKPGSIAGGISGYPYGSLPSLAIVAFGQDAPHNHSYLITSPGDTSYSMSTIYLLPGPFQVVAYDASGHSGGCPGLVTVISDQTVNCDITNWGGGYPPKPSDVPNP